MIRIQNIYHMLAYAFQVLQEQGYKDVAVEEFENTAELLSAILCKGVSVQIKRGLGRQYIAKEEPLSTPRGKIEVSESIKTQVIRKKQLVCTYDEFSVDAYMNRIIKTTMLVLLKANISKIRKKEIRKLLIFFDEVTTLDKNSINWHIQYDRNNQTYRMLMAICQLILEGLLQTQSDGKMHIMEFIDEQRMCRLYEKFILEYYKKHYPQITARAEQIPWQLDDGYGDMLPIMQTDIMLRKGDTVLIIDAKYYSHTTQVQYDVHTLHSNNLYQVFTYVKNKENELKNKPHQVSGMLLYARTDEDIYPNHTYQMSGNRIDVKTLNLDGEFALIKKQLDCIIQEFFEI